MRIITENIELIVIKSGNLFGYIIGSIFVLLGAVILLQPNDFVINTDIPWWMAFFIIILGLLSIFLPTIDYITFNKQTNKLEIRQRNIFWRRSGDYDLAQIKEIEMRLVPNGGRRGGYSQKLLCVMKSGEHIALPTKSSVSTIQIGVVGFNVSYVEKVGKKITEFLNVPFIDKGIPTVAEVINETVNTMPESFMKKIAEYQKSEKEVSLTKE
jgi:hypothetical protein